jgi:hypothetical protein
VPVLALRCRSDASAERVSHKLHSVADAKDRRTEIEQLRITGRRPTLEDTFRTARENDPSRAARPYYVARSIGWPHFRIDRQFPKSTRNQLRVLRSEIEDEDGLVGHGREPIEAIIAGWLHARPQYAVVLSR